MPSGCMYVIHNQPHGKHVSQYYVEGDEYIFPRKTIDKLFNSKQFVCGDNCFSQIDSQWVWRTKDHPDIPVVWLQIEEFPPAYFVQGGQKGGIFRAAIIRNYPAVTSIIGQARKSSIFLSSEIATILCMYPDMQGALLMKNLKHHAIAQYTFAYYNNTVGIISDEDMITIAGAQWEQFISDLRETL